MLCLFMRSVLNIAKYPVSICVLFFVTVSFSTGEKPGRFEIIINDNGPDHGCYQSYEYHLTQDSLLIIYCVDHAESSCDTLLQTSIPRSKAFGASKTATAFLNDSSSYVASGPQENPCDEQRQISIYVRTREKSVQYQLNHYNKRAFNLLELVNQCVPEQNENLKIKCSPDEFK